MKYRKDVTETKKENDKVRMRAVDNDVLFLLEGGKRKRN